MEKVKLERRATIGISALIDIMKRGFFGQFEAFRPVEWEIEEAPSSENKFKVDLLLRCRLEDIDFNEVLS